MRLKPTNEEAQVATFASGSVGLIGLIVIVTSDIVGGAMIEMVGMALFTLGAIGMLVPLLLVMVFGMHTPRINARQRNWNDEWFKERLD